MAEWNTRIRQKRDTEINWEATNPVLLDGELIIVDTADGSIRKKIGNGVDTYSKLPFDDEGLYDELHDELARQCGGEVMLTAVLDDGSEVTLNLYGTQDDENNSDESA